MMKIRALVFALSVGAAATLPSGCSGSQSPIGAPGAIPQSVAFAAGAGHGKSLPEAKGRNLLYVSSPQELYIFTYPRETLIDTIELTAASLHGECTDAAGDVFVVDQNYGAHEFRHRDTTIAANIHNAAGGSLSCSVDPVTGQLAISSDSGAVVVSTFTYNPKHGWRLAKNYKDSQMKYGRFCGYDDKGNLYVDGSVTASSDFVLAELAKGGSRLQDLSLNQIPKSPGQVQWDGKYLAIEDAASSPSEVHRFSISGTEGTQVGSLVLDGSVNIAQFWIQGAHLVGPDITGNRVGVWNYPSGGDETDMIKIGTPFGATISVAPKH